MANLLIDSTLREISSVTTVTPADEYKSGLLPWIKKSRPEEWARMLQMEEKINRVAFSGDRASLEDALSNYRGFFSEMMRVYGKGGVTHFELIKGNY